MFIGGAIIYSLAQEFKSTMISFVGAMLILMGYTLASELYYNERPSAEDQVDIQQEQLDIPQEQLEELNQIGILDKELNQINPNEIDLMKNNFINEDHS